MENKRNVIFKLGDLLFEYDEEKNKKNIQKHGISFKKAARVFLDPNRSDFFDEPHSYQEERYVAIGNISKSESNNIKNDDIIFVIHTERFLLNENNEEKNITRIISARVATSFERGLYYGGLYYKRT